MKRAQFLKSIFGAAGAVIAGTTVVGSIAVDKVGFLKPLDTNHISPSLDAKEVVAFYQKHGILINKVHFFREAHDEFSDLQA